MEIDMKLICPRMSELQSQVAMMRMPSLLRLWGMDESLAESGLTWPELIATIKQYALSNNITLVNSDFQLPRKWAQKNLSSGNRIKTEKALNEHLYFMQKPQINDNHESADTTCLKRRKSNEMAPQS